MTMAKVTNNSVALDITIWHNFFTMLTRKYGNPACRAIEGRLRIVVDHMINPESNK